MTAKTTKPSPNHALQRTVPGCHSLCCPPPSPPAAYRPRTGCASPPQSLSLGSLGDFARMTDFPSTSGDVDAYEFFVEMALHFHCSDCGEHMDCPVSDSDVSAPQPPWAIMSMLTFREGDIHL